MINTPNLAFAVRDAKSWILPSQIITDQGPIDSRIILYALGFVLADVDAFHYRAIKTPDGWTIETRVAATNVVLDETGELVFAVSYSPFQNDENCLIIFG